MVRSHGYACGLQQPQEKLDPAAIKKQQGDKAAAAKAQQNRASASNATALNVDAAGKVQTAQATNGTSSSVLAASPYSAPGFPDREFRMTQNLWYKRICIADKESRSHVRRRRPDDVNVHRNRFG